jgi:hypothetical protein
VFVWRKIFHYFFDKQFQKANLPLPKKSGVGMPPKVNFGRREWLENKCFFFSDLLKTRNKEIKQASLSWLDGMLSKPIPTPSSNTHYRVLCSFLVAS